MEEEFKKRIRGYINHIVPITDFDWKLFDDRLVFKKYDKGTILSRAGDIEKYMYFLVEGITSICHMRNGVEYTLRFNFPISIFNSYSSFISQSPSLVSVEALTDLSLFRMTYQDMQTLYDESPAAERIGRRMLELLYVQRELKELQMHSRTAEDYYCELVKTNKAFINEIPQKHLASYLGIAPESLSRIKKKIKCCEAENQPMA